jgi:LysM repeat protein
MSAHEAVSAICPYLTSSGGAWRMSGPSRDHRCAAVDPPAPQAPDKQRRHCLSPDHVECPVYRASRAARSSALAGGADPELIDAADRRRRPLARTAPVLLESPRLVDRAIGLQLDRAPGQVALVGLMVIAFAIVALARLSAGAAPVANPSPAASTVAVAPSPTVPPTPSPTSSVAVPSASPGPSAAPSFRTTYKVKKGDTLLSIASRYKTTAAKIRQLNGMTTSVLKIGQILKIP